MQVHAISPSIDILERLWMKNKRKDLFRILVILEILFMPREAFEIEIMNLSQILIN